jgi:hypothetical protein
VTLVAKNCFMRGQPNRMEATRSTSLTFYCQRTYWETIKLQTTVTSDSSFTPLFHVNNLRPFSIASRRPNVPVTTPEDDDDEVDVSHISVVCIQSLQG